MADENIAPIVVAEVRLSIANGLTASDCLVKHYCCWKREGFALKHMYTGLAKPLPLPKLGCPRKKSRQQVDDFKAFFKLNFGKIETKHFRAIETASKIDQAFFLEGICGKDPEMKSIKISFPFHLSKPAL